MELMGSGFVLRPWHLEDALSIQHHADNPNVSAFLADRFPYPYTLDDAMSWVNLMQNQNPLVNFVIAVDGKAVGGIALEMRQDVHQKTPLLGYWLGEAYWGKGIMPEAVKLITNYAFAHLDIICIQAFIFSGNPASMRVLEKAGYEKQGVIKHSIVKRGKIWNEHVYAMLNPQAVTLT
ncbi:GNAT family protein [Mucilaginibacter sp. PAMB04274]|uniref:GNAT family N-acetyltransferase n=1 Tax=Mucilaginibacter sp. PAMB04274 TaxID=3138568 RepID=UPI0031F71E6F